MTVKELKERIKNLPDGMNVMIRQENNEDGLFSEIGYTGLKEIRFDGEDYSEEDGDFCFCITD